MLVNNDNNSTVAVVCILYSGMMLCVVCHAALTCFSETSMSRTQLLSIMAVFCWTKLGLVIFSFICFKFLADRTNGRAIATLLRLSVVRLW